MGTGYHGGNGISPAYTIAVYRTYVLPRLMFGLEGIVLKDKQVRWLDEFHRKTLRELQTLPPRTAKCAIHLMSGMPTLECLLDIQIAMLMCAVAEQPNGSLTYIGQHQLATYM